MGLKSNIQEEIQASTAVNGLEQRVETQFNETLKELRDEIDYVKEDASNHCLQSIEILKSNMQDEIQASAAVLDTKFDEEHAKINETLDKFRAKIEDVSLDNSINGLEKRVKVLENKLKFRCPTEKNGYKLLENQCYFFEKVNRDYGVTQEYCLTAFGPNFAGKMWEPQSLQINNVVGAEAERILGKSKYVWIGITNDGLYKFQSNGVPVAYEMPYAYESHRTNYIGTNYCLAYYLVISKWDTSYCLGSSTQHYTVCELEK